ncbi:MAG: DNA polymerase/3'-5' exonuclease PolX [Planctomycetota bacterium]|nr:DNA polymerase/3'-5' exonuclease PolX [Planctomycetota bacterium]
MSMNEDIAKIFEELATLLELTGANGFRVNAHAKIARVVEGLTTDLGEPARSEGGLKAIEAIDGIGKSSAQKIVEFATLGTVAELEQLRASVPDGLREVMKVPGLGPKTVRRLWQEAEIESIGDLEAAIDDGRLKALPRMGQKTIDNIRESIDFMKTAGDRRRLGTAMPIAERLVAAMQAIPGVRKVAYAGSLRRGQETIGDLDLLVTTTDPTAASEAFRTQSGVTKILVAGETKSSVRLEDGIQVDLRVVPEEVWGAALMYFTGSKDHNVALRERAIGRGLRLNEYGLFPDDGEDGPPQQRGVVAIASATEAEIYQALDLPWIPPELRVDRDEFDLEVPNDLITVDAIRAELHSHTTASDGRLTIEELAVAARAAGRTVLAITDHSRSSAQANGLDEDRLRMHIDAIREADARIEGIRLLAGSEVDIHADGSLDYEDDVLALLDVVVASPHASLRQDPDTATARLCAAARHPLVSIIGHPTGRLIGTRKGLEPDIEQLITAAIEGGTALEINANPYRLDLRDIHVRAAVDAGCLISINTDAHRAEHLEFIRYGVMTGRRGRLRIPGCLNAWPEERLLEWLGRNR